MNSLNNLNFELQPWQERFIFAPYKYKFLKSAWATGKSLSLILVAMEESEKYEDNLGVIFRKEYKDLEDSTCKDFMSNTGLKIDSHRNVELPNKSVIMFRHLEEMNNIQNLNLGWFGIEQGEELDTDEYFYKLTGRLRRQNSSRRAYVISNANGHNWIYKIRQQGVFDPVNNERLDAHYAAKTFDNKENLTEDYLRSLEALKINKPSIYNRLVGNSDEEQDTVDITICPEWVRKAYSKDVLISSPIRRVISVDVARYGDDKTVYYALEMGGNGQKRLIAREERQKLSTMETVGWGLKFAEEHKINAYAVDEIGVGAGVADRLEELKKEVVFINSSKESTYPEKYYNRRTEMYAMAAEDFQQGIVEIPETDTELVEQLTWARYKEIKSNGKLQVEPKQEIKERYKRSPDNADAFVAGLWSLPHVSIAETRDAYNLKRRNKQSFNPETV